MKKKKKNIKAMKEKKVEKYNMFSEKEIEVSEFLVELHRMILDLEVPLISLLPFTWGCKKIRSSIQYYTPTTALTTCAEIAPPLPLHHGGAAVSTPFAAASSPATSLSLSLIESGDKAKIPLPGEGSITKEIENVKHYSEHLKASNLKFKARKQELSYNSSNKSSQKKPNLGSECPMQFVYAPNPINSPNLMVGNNLQYTTQYVAFMLNQTCGPTQICNNTKGIAQFQYMSCNHSMPMQIAPSSLSSLSCSPNSSNAALGLVNNTSSSSSSSNMGQIGNLDLNVSSEEFINVHSCQKPLDLNVVNRDLNRVIAAQARQRRIQINKLKNPILTSEENKVCAYTNK